MDTLGRYDFSDLSPGKQTKENPTVPSRQIIEVRYLAYAAFGIPLWKASLIHSGRGSSALFRLLLSTSFELYNFSYIHLKILE